MAKETVYRPPPSPPLVPVAAPAAGPTLAPTFVVPKKSKIDSNERR